MLATTDRGSAPEAGEPGHVIVRGFPAPHAFTTRAGGVSVGPYASLNLGLSVPDDPGAVAENRRRVASWFGARPGRLATIHQVHGTRVVEAREASPEVRADAIVSDDPSWTLAVSVADCVPVLLHDPESGAVAAVHAGWRGTAAGVIGACVATMTRRYGSRPASLTAAVGPAISGDAYQVGPEVVEAFVAAGLPADVAWPDPNDPGRHRLSVAAGVRHALLDAGLSTERILDGGWCTASRPESFFSHRRDAGRTGRHWALVRATGDGVEPGRRTGEPTAAC